MCFSLKSQNRLRSHNSQLLDVFMRYKSVISNIKHLTYAPQTWRIRERDCESINHGLKEAASDRCLKHPAWEQKREISPPTVINNITCDEEKQGWLGHFLQMITSRRGEGEIPKAQWCLLVQWKQGETEMPPPKTETLFVLPNHAKGVRKVKSYLDSNCRSRLG